MEKFKKFFTRETIDYITFGFVTTVIDLLIYFILAKIGVNILLANVCAWFVATAFAFYVQKKYVFKSKSARTDIFLKEAIGFVGGRLFTMFFSLMIIYGSAVILGVNDIIAKYLGALFVVIVNYILSKFYIFVKQKGNTEKITVRDFFKKNMVYILSTIIPIVIMIMVYKSRKIYPFGDNTYLKSDCYHQYLPFLKEMYNKLVNGGSIEYSWNIGLGTGFSALYAYYLATPLNWLLPLVNPIHLPEVINTYIILKTALCCLTMSIYLSNHFKTRNVTVAGISIFYGMSSYLIAFSWNIMWLDCILLFPLIMLGLERIVKEHKCFLYCFTLGISILSNYYISIMICIFCVFYFAYLFFTTEKVKKIRSILEFAGFSLLAGGIGAVTFLPAFSTLSSTASSDFDFPKKLESYFSVLDMLARSFINVDLSIFEAHQPNLYCTMAVFILVPLYIVNPKINIKEKVGKVSLAALLLFAFNTNIPNYIWHGFHYPNSLPARQSFIYIWVVLVMAFEAVHNIREITTKQLAGCFSGAVAFVLLIQKLYVETDGEIVLKAEVIYTGLAFMLFYTIVLMLLRSKSFNAIMISYMLIIVAVCECYVNVQNTGFAPCTRSAYLNDSQAIDDLVKKAEEEDTSNFFRIEKKDRRTKNDASFHGYKGCSIFSSTAPAAMSELYGNIGMEDSTNAYGYYGATPLTSAMLSVKYLLSKDIIDDDDHYEFYSQASYTITDYLDNKTEDSKGTYYMYKNKYWLPLGFMVDQQFEEKIDWANPISYETLNSVARGVAGKNMYTRMPVNVSGRNNEVNITEETHLTIYVTTSVNAITVTINNGLDPAINSSKTYSNMRQTHILDLGVQPKGTTVTVTSADEETSEIQMYAYSYDDSVFQDIYKVFSMDPFEVTTLEDTLVEGKVTASGNGLLYTSIPYDKGWKAYVDGKEYKIHAFQDALISLNLTKGEHTIRFEYVPQGLRAGSVLTILSLIILVTLFVLDSERRKRNVELKE